jgi:hypothetical protein
MSGGVSFPRVLGLKAQAQRARRNTSDGGAVRVDDTRAGVTVARASAADRRDFAAAEVHFISA